MEYNDAASYIYSVISAKRISTTFTDDGASGGVMVSKID